MLFFCVFAVVYSLLFLFYGGTVFVYFFICLYQGGATHKPAGQNLAEVKWYIKGVRKSDGALLTRKQEEEVTLQNNNTITNQ